MSGSLFPSLFSPCPFTADDHILLNLTAVKLTLGTEKTLEARLLLIRNIFYLLVGSSWITTGWNFHHIGWLINVCDGTLKLKLSNPRIPKNENINNPYKTDMYGSGSWPPVNSFRLSQTDTYFNLPSEIQ